MEGTSPKTMAYLWVWIRFLRMMGKIVPPILEPPAMHAKAKPSFLWNQCATTPDPALNTIPLASYKIEGR